MIFAGFDPGFAKAAIAVLRREGTRIEILHLRRILTYSKWGQKEREAHLWHELTGPIVKYRPTVLSIENQSNVSTAARMAQRRVIEALKRGQKPPKELHFQASNDNVIGSVWYAKAAARAYGVAYEEPTPQQIKIGLLGPGAKSATKEQMIAQVIRLFPELADRAVSEHEADAIGVALTGERMHRFAG